MQPISETPSSERLSSTTGPRKFLVAIDDSYACERALDWAMTHFYRTGDEVHLIHVIPQPQGPAVHSAPPVDFLPQQNSFHEDLERRAGLFIEDRFLAKLRDLDPKAVTHVIKGVQDTDGIGHIICKTAVNLPAVAVVIASQGKSRFQQFFLGSTSAYVSKTCRVPVIVVH